MKKILTSSLLAILGLVIFAACSTDSASNDEEGDGKLKVVVTNSILADMAETIGQDRIELHSIVPVGKDPHEYEPLPEDVQKTSKADVIFYNGINLETGGNAWFKIGRAHV